MEIIIILSIICAIAGYGFASIIIDNDDYDDDEEEERF